MKVSIEDLGLNVVALKTSRLFSKKDEFLAKYPEWTSYLENPEAAIPLLFKEKNWQMIGNLLDANIDSEVEELIFQSLFAEPATGIQKALQISMIERATASELDYLVKEIFSRPIAKGMEDLLQLVVEKAKGRTLFLLARNVFLQEHSKDMEDLVELVLKKGGTSVFLPLQARLADPRMHGTARLLQAILERTPDFSPSLKDLALNVFSKPHTQGMIDLLRQVVEKGDEVVLRDLAKYVFSQPFAQTREHQILRQSLEIQDSRRRRIFIEAQFLGLKKGSLSGGLVCSKVFFGPQ